MKIGIVISRYHKEITDGLLHGALEYLSSQKIKPAQVVDSPGAYEIPLLAKAIAKSSRLDGVICLGCVIKGDTAHFEYICSGVSYGLQNVSLELGIPVTFGVLTTYTEEQALLRSKPDTENKGLEAAQACLDSIKALNKMENLK